MSEKTQKILHAQMVGAFDIRCADGISYAPKSARARAAIAMVLSSPGMTRSRKWLSEHLWSDRMATQCSGSTRGMMSELRRTFKDVPHAISVNRTDVTLHEAFWRTDADSEDLKDPSDFLENIELRDPCYVEWRHNQAKALIQKRTQANTTESAAQHLALMQLPGSGAINEGLSIGMRVEGGSSIATELVSTMLASQIGRNMGDQVTARLYDHTGEAQPNDNHDIGITCHIAEGAQRSTAFLKIIQNADRRVLFVRNIELPTDAAAAFQNNSLSKTAFLAAEEVLSKLVTQSHLQRPVPPAPSARR